VETVSGTPGPFSQGGNSAGGAPGGKTAAAAGAGTAAGNGGASGGAEGPGSESGKGDAVPGPARGGGKGGGTGAVRWKESSAAACRQISSGSGKGPPGGPFSGAEETSGGACQCRKGDSPTGGKGGSTGIVGVRGKVSAATGTGLIGSGSGAVSPIAGWGMTAVFAGSMVHGATAAA
jgi:hypothetical protein